MGGTWGFVMTLRKVFLSGAVAAMAAMSAAALPGSAGAVTVHVGTVTPGGYFFLTSGTPFTPSITADFGATVLGSSTAFDDTFDFTIPQDGTGSGSVSTSFSSVANELTISDVTINGTSFTAAQAAAGVGGIPIMDGVLNSIEVVGTTAAGATAATFSGTATFTASAAPEPSTWMLMIGGIGLIGAMLRRRSTAVRFA